MADMPSESGYGRFNVFLGTQFLLTIALVGAARSVPAGAPAAIPFLLCAGYSGHLADRFSKARIIQLTALLLGLAALSSGWIEWLLLSAIASTFGPAIFGMVPEMVAEARIVRANGLLQTIMAAGALIGGLLYPRSGPLLPGIALAALLASFGIGKVPAARPAEIFHWNPLHEIIEGARELRTNKSLALPVWGISWFWFVTALFLLVQPLTAMHLAALAAGFGLGSIAAGALSGDYIELALVPAGLALAGFFSIWPQAIPNLILIGCGGGLFTAPLNAYLQREAPAARKGRTLATAGFANMLAVELVWILHRHFPGSGAAIFPALGLTMFLASLVLTVRMPQTVVRFILWCVAMALFRIRLEGRENIPRTGGALLVSNHISYADAVLVGCAARLRTVHFLMWQPIFDVPVANYFFRLLEAIPIDATSPKSTVRALHAAREQLERGEIVGIFPEGSISRTGEIERFERGFEKILQGTGAPVIPIHIGELWGHPLSCKGGAPFRSWQKLWRPVVTVRIGAPIQSSIAGGSLTGTELRQSVVNLAANQAR